MVPSPPPSPAAGRLVDACSTGSILLTLHHSSPHALLRAYVSRQTPSGPVLSHAGDTPIPCPPHAMPVSLLLAPTYALVAWSSGATTVVQLSTNPFSPGPAQPPKLLHFSPPPSITSAVTANGLLSAGATEPGAHAGINGDASSAATASARKRKAPSADGTAADATAGPAHTSPFLAAPLDDTQLLVACVCPAPASSAAPASTVSAASHELQYAVLERQFGVVVHTGSLPLEGVLGASASQPRLFSHPEGSPGTLVLQASGSVFSLYLEVPPASLISMVGRLAVTPSLSNPSSDATTTTTTTTPPAHPSQQLLLAPQHDAAAQTSGGGSGRLTPSATLAPPPPQAELDVHALAATLQARQAQQVARVASMAAATPAGGVQGDAAAPLSPETAAGEYALQDLQSVQGELVHAVDATPLQLEQALAHARLKQQPPPLSTLQQAADAVAAAYHHHYHQQQHHQQQPQQEGQEQQGHQVHQQQQSGRKGRSSASNSSARKTNMGGDSPSHSLLAASRLAPLVALACADGEHWEVLRGLLQAVPGHSLTGCSGVLLAVARGQQYQLLPLAACALEDVPPAELVQVVQALLAPTQTTNLEVRRAYHRQLRAAAEGEVQQAEQQLQGLAPGPAASGAAAMAVDGAEGEEHDEDDLAARRRSALAHAHCAAAAVDGFALHEVLLHVPLALHADVAGLQACVRQLSNAQVDRLLAYLAKWVGKYSQGPLAQLSGSNAVYMATMPPALMFPLFSQVLDWLRVVIDGHLPRLLMAKQPPAALQGLQMALKTKVEACQQLLPLQGAIEHVRAGAPLPHAHVAASTMYTVEYVDLGLPIPS